MYPKKINSLNAQDKREKEKIQRREQLKNLIVNKFRSKYVYGAPNTSERDQIISDEVAKFIETQQCTEKNLIQLDKKLMQKFGITNSGKVSQARSSRKGSQASRMSSNFGSKNSQRSAMVRAGLNISSHDRAMDSTYSKHKNFGPAGASTLNNSHIANKGVDEWDSLIISDSKKYEEELRQNRLKKLEMKRKVRDELNAQMQEKKKLNKIEQDRERVLDQKRETINRMNDRQLNQKEMFKTRKNQEERRVMETQIAEIENMKRFEREKEIALALSEKQKVDQALQDELQREKNKKREYQEVCQKQYQENMQLKEYLKQQERQKMKDENSKKRDMFGDMFEEK